MSTSRWSTVCEESLNEMEKKLLSLVILSVVFKIKIESAIGAASEKVYEGFKVYDITPKTENDLKCLKKLEADQSDAEPQLDFLSFHNNLNDVVRVAVDPRRQSDFEKILKESNIDFKIKTANLQKNIDDEAELVKKSSYQKNQIMQFDRYYRAAEINKFLDALVTEDVPNAKIKVSNIGKSHEGRTIKLVSLTNGDGRPKKSVFIDAGIHAREWIAPATALYFMHELINPESNYSKLLDKMDFHIQPLVNPDGYEFSMDRWRLWRKNRRRTGICSGIDLNRNYDFSWNTGGSSSNQCSEVYHGTRGFSEVETQVSSNAILERSENCKFFLTLHSYGNYILYPWGYKAERAENWKDQEAVVQAGAKAIKDATGTDFTVGSTAETLYPAAGSSVDYAHSTAKIPISVVMELQGGGFFGFDFPANELKSAVRESAIGIAAMCEEVARIYE